MSRRIPNLAFFLSLSALTAATAALVVCVAFRYFHPGISNAATPWLWTVRGTSMLPTLRSGDRDISVVQNFTALHPGEIVIFRPQGNWTPAAYVVHRIVRGFGGRWVTKGDNNAREDPGYLTSANYVATVALILPKGRAAVPALLWKASRKAL